MRIAGSPIRFSSATSNLLPVPPRGPAAQPSWDSSGRVLFTIDVLGESVGCTISHAALEDLSGGRCYGSTASLARFTSVRSAIELLAKQKYQSRGVGIYGRVNLWDTDIDEPPARNCPATAAGLPHDHLA
jgi:hypothetical protein